MLIFKLGAVILTTLLLVAPASAGASASDALTAPVDPMSAPTAHASVLLVNLKIARNRSTKQAKKYCKNREIFIEWGIPYRKCEGWFAGNCLRESLYRPDYGTCYLNAFLDDAARGELNCQMIQGWRARRATRSQVPIRTKRGTIPWSCSWTSSPEG